MHSKKINPIIRWWVTPKLPYEDIFAKHNFITQWLVHPIKRRIARIYLKLLRRFGKVKVIGITGSAGKTTTKEMLKSILELDGKTILSPQNIDPVYNIPNTILKTSPLTKYLILEMGVEYRGEMDFYLWLVKPDIGIITNIYPTHTEFFGDIGGVFREKRKLVDCLDITNFAVLNATDNKSTLLKGKLKAKEIWFGNGTGVMSSKESITKDLKTKFTLIFNQNRNEKTVINLQLPGRHYIENALAASACAKVLGIDLKTIKRGLERVQASEHRAHIYKLPNNTIVYDDSYNSNPMAVKKSLEAFEEVSGKSEKLIIFGDMLELGNLEKKYHLDIAKLIIKLPISQLICIGPLSRITADFVEKRWGKDRVSWFENTAAAIRYVKKSMRPNMYIFIKGSHSIGLSKIVDELT